MFVLSYGVKCPLITEMRSDVPMAYQKFFFRSLIRFWNEGRKQPCVLNNKPFKMSFTFSEKRRIYQLKITCLENYISNLENDCRLLLVS